MCKKNISAIFFSLILSFAAIPSFAGTIELAEYTSFINATEFGSTSLQHTGVGFGYDDYTSSGLDVVFTNALDVNNYGSVSWSVTNSTSMDLTNVLFFGFLDAQIDEATTSFFNEIVDESGLILGSGSADTTADTWEADEPGFLFGDIFSHLLDGALDGTNGTSGIEEDVSMALGFDLGNVLSEDTIVATFDISDTDNGGLYHYDPLSDFGFYFTGLVDVVGASTEVPEPPTMFLVGLVGILFLTKRNRKLKQQI